MIKPINIDYSYINQQKLEEIKKIRAASSEEQIKLDYILDFYEEKKKNNNIEEFVFSLNKLIEDIYLIMKKL